MDSTEVLNSTPFHQTQPTVKFVANTDMIIPRTAREPEPTLQRKTNRRFMNSISLCSFLNTCALLRKLLRVMPSERIVLNLRSASRGAKSVDELLLTNAGFG